MTDGAIIVGAAAKPISVSVETQDGGEAVVAPGRTIITATTPTGLKATWTIKVVKKLSKEGLIAAPGITRVEAPEILIPDSAPETEIETIIIDEAPDMDIVPIAE